MYKKIIALCLIGLQLGNLSSVRGQVPNQMLDTLKITGQTFDLINKIDEIKNNKVTWQDYKTVFRTYPKTTLALGCCVGLFCAGMGTFVYFMRKWDQKNAREKAHLAEMWTLACAVRQSYEPNSQPLTSLAKKIDSCYSYNQKCLETPDQFGKTARYYLQQNNARELLRELDAIEKREPKSAAAWFRNFYKFEAHRNQSSLSFYLLDVEAGLKEKLPTWSTETLNMPDMCGKHILDYTCSDLATSQATALILQAKNTDGTTKLEVPLKNLWWKITNVITDCGDNDILKKEIQCARWLQKECGKGLVEQYLNHLDTRWDISYKKNYDWNDTIDSIEKLEEFQKKILRINQQKEA